MQSTGILQNNYYKTIEILQVNYLKYIIVMVHIVPSVRIGENMDKVMT